MAIKEVTMSIDKNHFGNNMAKVATQQSDMNSFMINISDTTIDNNNTANLVYWWSIINPRIIVHDTLVQ